MKWVLVDPVAKRATRPEDAIVTRTSPLRTIGFLENHKANASELQREAGRRLASAVPLDQRFYGKMTASLAAPQDLIARIADECDVVLVGSAD